METGRPPFGSLSQEEGSRVGAFDLGIDVITSQNNIQPVGSFCSRHMACLP